MCSRQAHASLAYEMKPIKGNTRCYLVNMLCMYIVQDCLQSYQSVCDRGQIFKLAQA